MGATDSGRILLVEDDLVSQRQVAAVLSDNGYAIDRVYDGGAAVTASAFRHYDAILMDLQMPGMDGYQATSAIREREGCRWHTPIIAVTAANDPWDRARRLASGMDAHLGKPWRPMPSWPW